MCLNFLAIRFIHVPSGTTNGSFSASVIDDSFWRETNDGKHNATGCKQTHLIGFKLFIFHSLSIFLFSLTLFRSIAEKYSIIAYVVTYTLTLFASMVEEKNLTDVSCKIFTFRARLKCAFIVETAASFRETFFV